MLILYRTFESTALHEDEATTFEEFIVAIRKRFDLDAASSIRVVCGGKVYRAPTARLEDIRWKSSPIVVHYTLSAAALQQRQRSAAAAVTATENATAASASRAAVQSVVVEDGDDSDADDVQNEPRPAAAAAPPRSRPAPVRRGGVNSIFASNPDIDERKEESPSDGSSDEDSGDVIITNVGAQIARSNLAWNELRRLLPHTDNFRNMPESLFQLSRNNPVLLNPLIANIMEHNPEILGRCLAAADADSGNRPAAAPLARNNTVDGNGQLSQRERREIETLCEMGFAASSDAIERLYRRHGRNRDATIDQLIAGNNNDEPSEEQNEVDESLLPRGERLIGSDTDESDDSDVELDDEAIGEQIRAEADLRRNRVDPLSREPVSGNAPSLPPYGMQQDSYDALHAFATLTGIPTSRGAGVLRRPPGVGPRPGAPAAPAPSAVDPRLAHMNMVRGQQLDVGSILQDDRNRLRQHAGNMLNRNSMRPGMRTITIRDSPVQFRMNPAVPAQYNSDFDGDDIPPRPDSPVD
jgi:hypothetical protein